MKKAILSLAAVLTMFASASAFAAPVADSASDTSISPVVTNAEPQIKIEYLSTLDVPRDSVSFVDGRNLSLDQGETVDNIVNKGETKRFQRYQLSKGQKLTATIDWYNKFLSDGSEQNGWDAFVKSNFKPVQKVEKNIEKDGYYSIELVAPTNESNVNQYHVVYHIKVQ